MEHVAVWFIVDVCEALEMAEGIGCDLYLYLLRAWIDSMLGDEKQM